MTPLQTIREAVVKAVPEIVELKFGCLVKNQRGYTFTILSHQQHRGFHMFSEISPMQNIVCTERDMDVFEIIGRKITLVDVLRTVKLYQDRIESCKGVYAVQIDGTFVYLTADAGEEYVQSRNNWNLSLPLDGQSEETLKFLADILK